MTFNGSCHLGLGYVRPWRFDLGSCAATCIYGYPSDFYRNFACRQFSELKKWLDFSLR